MEFKKKTEYLNPWTKANFLSKLFFWWITPSIMKGSKGNFKLTDIYDCPNNEASESIGEIVEKEWNIEVSKLKKGKKPSLFKATVRCFGLMMCLNGLLTLIEMCFVQVLQPVLLGYLIQHFAKMKILSMKDMYLCAAGVCLLTALVVMTRHQYMLRAQMIGMKARIACCRLIYKKALKLSQAALNRTTVGQMVNLLSNDVTRFDQSAANLAYLVTAPIHAVVVTAVLWMYIGYASIACVAVLILNTPFQGMMGIVLSKIRMKTAILTDERIRLMNQIIEGIRVIKMYGWEIPFANLVNACRRKEMKKIRKAAIISCLHMGLFQASAKVTLLVTFIVFVLGVKGDLTPEKLFVTIGLFHNLRLSLFLHFYEALTKCAESSVSFKRIQDFLLLEEQEKSPLMDIADIRPKLCQCGVWMQNVVASWNKEGEKTLLNVSLTVEPGELLAVVGPVGCGKTSLLTCILGELPIMSGKVKVRGKVSYASQDSWIFSGSLKENVIFGSEYDEVKYKTVLSVCALHKDIEQLPYGDETIVGERGIHLSGGQKARVNLARAMYFDADIFLLDDPLSAVDSAVSKHLFEKCINGYLKEKVTILATHQIQFLKRASRILVLKQGKCPVIGTYQELTDSGLDLGSFLEDYEGQSQPELKSLSLNGSSISFNDTGTDSDAINSSHKSTLFLESSISNDLKNINPANTNEKAPRIAEEIKASGSIKLQLYKDYVKSGAGPFVYTFILFLLVSSQALLHGSDFFLAAWTYREQRKYNIKDCWTNANKTYLTGTGYYNDTYGIFDQHFFRRNVANVSDDCFKMTDNYTEDLADAEAKMNMEYFFSVYAGFALFIFISMFARFAICTELCMRSSINLHNEMLRSILHSPVSFFDDNPVGRVLNRFSKDIGAIDEVMPFAANFAFIVFLNTLGVLCVVVIVEPWLMLPSFIFVITLLLVRRFYWPTAREIKRYEGIARSYIFSHLSTSLYGLTTIRAFKVQLPFELSFDRHQDQHTATWFMLLSVNNWFGFVLDWLSVLFITCTTVAMVLLGEDPTYASIAGLAMESSFQLCGQIPRGIRQLTEVESQMTCVERVMEYSSLQSEPAFESKNDKKPPEKWPINGRIIYQSVSLRYSPNAPHVLKKLCFEIYPEEKIGIVGRTGAGKSSIIATLFRLAEPEGLIKIDGISTKDIGLHDLRKKISIIPQDPVLFTGPIRRNLDLFSEHNDTELWQALEGAYLKNVIKEMPTGLDTNVSEGGSNFSVGQRQLLCLARAILRRNKILVLDEATANVDNNTDSLIQKTIRDRFAHCTVLTIAHRLHTVMDSDRVMVLDAGEVKEFEEPHTLLQDENSLFSHMVQMTGASMSQQLREVARTAQLKKGESKKENASNVFGNSGQGDVAEMNGSAPFSRRISIVVEQNDSDGLTIDMNKNQERTYL